jgi:hypothetical protein
VGLVSSNQHIGRRFLAAWMPSSTFSRGMNIPNDSEISENFLRDFASAQFASSSVVRK